MGSKPGRRRGLAVTLGLLAVTNALTAVASFHIGGYAGLLDGVRTGSGWATASDAKRIVELLSTRPRESCDALHAFLENQVDAGLASYVMHKEAGRSAFDFDGERYSALDLYAPALAKYRSANAYRSKSPKGRALVARALRMINAELPSEARPGQPQRVEK